MSFEKRPTIYEQDVLLGETFQAVYETFLEGFEGNQVSGEVVFGEVCKSFGDRSNLTWGRVTFDEGVFANSTYTVPVAGKNPDYKVTTYTVTRREDGRYIQECVMTWASKGDSEPKMMSNAAPVTEPFAQRLVHFIRYATKENLVNIAPLFVEPGDATVENSEVVEPTHPVDMIAPRGLARLTERLRRNK